MYVRSCDAEHDPDRRMEGCKVHRVACLLCTRWSHVTVYMLELALTFVHVQHGRMRMIWMMDRGIDGDDLRVVVLE